MKEGHRSLDNTAEYRLTQLFAECNRLPRTGDKFFVTSSSAVPIDRWHTRSIFERPGDPNFLLYKEYAFAHKTAVYTLCGEAGAGDTGLRALSSLLRPKNDERLVFPILMCLHQHFELLLKLIFHWIRGKFEEGQSHRLHDLWASILSDRPELAWGRCRNE
jgi:hypothetical protein